MNAWDDVLCQICFKPFTELTWENRHTIPDWHNAAGGDCHARCCPHPACRQWRKDAADKRQAAKEKARL
jgi:hypothetical protein